MLQKLVDIIEGQLDLEGVEITAATSFKEDLDVDSLDLFEMVMSIEEEFGVEIPSEKLEDMKSVGDVMNYLKENGVAE